MVIVAVQPQPISPTWSELEGFFLGNCTKRVKTPAQTLNWRKVMVPGNVLSPHAFCPMSAECFVIPQSLAGITYKRQTQFRNATTFIYLTAILTISFVLVI